MVTKIDCYFKKRAIKPVYIFLPCNLREKNYYDNLKSALPDSIAPIDLHKKYFNKINKIKYIADNHYSKEWCNVIGKDLSVIIDSLLQN